MSLTAEAFMTLAFDSFTFHDLFGQIGMNTTMTILNFLSLAILNKSLTTKFGIHRLYEQDKDDRTLEEFFTLAPSKIFHAIFRGVAINFS